MPFAVGGGGVQVSLVLISKKTPVSLGMGQQVRKLTLNVKRF